MVNMGVRQNGEEEEDEDDNGFDDGSKPPRIEIRITAPSSGRAEILVNYEIRMQLQGAGAELNLDNALPLVPSAQAMYEEEILEAVLSIRYGVPYNTVRESSIAFARRWCGTVGHGLHDAVRLEFLSPDSYYLRCKSQHQDVAVASFSLGAFLNYGLFVDHFRLVGHPMPVVMDFEHDCKQMDLFCMFDDTQALAEQHRREQNGGGRRRQQNGGGGGPPFVIYRLSFKYDAIHSIVVDYGGDYGDAAQAVLENTNEEEANREATVIYFQLKRAPKIDKKRLSGQNGNNNQYRNRQQQQNFGQNMNAYEECMANYRRGRGYYNRDRCMPNLEAETIGKCNTLKVVLWPFFPGGRVRRMGDSRDAWHDTVNEILSRVKRRSGCRVYFTGVRTKPPGSGITISTAFVDSFKCYYLLHALIFTRPYNIQDQVNNVFLGYVRQCVMQNEKAAELALSQLLAATDENRYFSLMNAFRKVFEVYVNEQATMAAAAAAQQQQQQPPPSKQAKLAVTIGEEEEIAKNCVKVRKLMVTPTRAMLLPPEVIVSNRILRKFGEEYALRVVIRDEDGQKVQGSRMDSWVLEKWTESIMKHDYVIGDRRYQFLSWSNSQLRDHAFYMYADIPGDGSTVPPVDVRVIRKWCGDFTAIQNVPKFMSRMGQCFTQAQTSLELPWHEGQVGQEEDVMGGDPDPTTGELYNFSDGIGRISTKLSEEVCRRLDVTPVRSAYQIRYAGYKGMLEVDPDLDKDPSGKQMMLRKSMNKFTSDNSCMLEIVKYSQPSPVYLNRPLVMILDQVSDQPLRSRRRDAGGEGSGSGGSGYTREAVHRKVCDHVHSLMDEELFSMADMLLSENTSVTALTTKTTLSIDFKRLKEAGFKLTTEPFFRGMLLSIHQYTIKLQLWKQKIEVPASMGRTMYGVLDTTSILQYGQVFVQYSKNIDKPGEDLQIVEGYVMVTKNPCIVPGDVRILKAVQVPALKGHMHDVIVFPQNGPRSHPDEMAGSDLDGDEYSVYWDPVLMFNIQQVQKPMHFPKNKPTDLEGGIKVDHMVDFFIHYLRQDSIGMVSHAHLALADRYGLFDPRTNDVAKKCSLAVDFPKTGVPAEPLTPDERPKIWADCFEKYHKPMYRSKKLVGKLYRRVKNASDIIRLGQDSVSKPNSETNHCDYDLEVPGWQLYQESAVADRNRYVQYLQSLLDQYGISDEASLISGHMVGIRNRLSDGDKEDFSFWNTEKIIELRLSKILLKFRHRFFEEFVGGGGEITEEMLDQPDERMRQKASAWYMVTYARQTAMRGRVMLSFPWIVWEILRYIKMTRTFEKYSRNLEERVIDPTAEALTKSIQEFGSRNPEMIARLISLVTAEESSDAQSGGDLVTFYTQAYNPDFTNLLGVVLHWAEREIRFDRDYSLKPIYIARLLVDFCQTNHFLEKREIIVREDQENQQVPASASASASYSNSTTGRRLTSKGDILLAFLKYLAWFKHQEDIVQKICQNEATLHLRRRQCQKIGQVAFRTYHHVAWTNKFDSLHLQSGSRLARAALSWDREETDAVTVAFDYSLSRRMTEEEVEKKLKEWSGVDDVCIRQKNDQCEYLVTGAGSLEARQALHEILLDENLTQHLVDNTNLLLTQEF